MFRYGYGRSLSSVPHYLTAPNGLNFRRSVGNPNSRLEKIRKYLSDNGPRSKRDILRDVFGLNPAPHQIRGYHSYVFQYGVKHGFFRKERKGNITYWSLT